MPFGYMPPFNVEQNEIKRLSDKVDNLEKRLNKLEKKIEALEKNNAFPMPYNMPNFPNNYMM